MSGIVNSAGSRSGVIGIAHLTSFAIIGDLTTSNSGGPGSTGSYLTRPLDTIIMDNDNIVSIASDQFTLQAGKYTFDWSCGSYDIGHHATRIYNETASAHVGQGINQYQTADAGNERSMWCGGFAATTIGAISAFKVQHYSSIANSTDGYGRTFVTGQSTYMTLVKIIKYY